MTNRRFLHVANGTATTSLIEAAGLPGLRVQWADVLYEGPVPAAISDDELLIIRGQFLAGQAGVDELRHWRQTLAAHGTYDEIVLWYEHDLFDQLNLLQLLPYIQAHVPDTRMVSLICIGSFPGRPRFKGLGELTPAELAPLLGTREPARADQYALAAEGWRAFRAPTPEPLDQLRRSDDAHALPFLSAAIRRFLQEYPSVRDGLSRSERRLLHLVADGPIDVIAAFPRMADDEQAYYITDGSLATLVDTLARTSPPLITIHDRSPSVLLSGTIEITAAGREVLAGVRDRTTAGLDRWFGGVHLQSPVAWRWDEDQDRIVGLDVHDQPRNTRNSRNSST